MKEMSAFNFESSRIVISNKQKLKKIWQLLNVMYINLSSPEVEARRVSNLKKNGKKNLV